MATVDKNEQTLSNIQSLQSLEQNLFNSLATGVSNGTLKSTDKDSIIKQINQLSQMRSNLFTFLNSNSLNTIENLAASNNLLSQQAQTVMIVENELNDAKKQLFNMQKDKYSKLRMVEINTYYGDRYADHSSMMKSIVIICVVIILITIIFNNGFLPSQLYYLMLIIIVVVSVIVLWYKYIMLISHDKMNYDEYNWGFNPDTAPKYDTSNPSGTKPWAPATTALTIQSSPSSSSSCVGSACCSHGMTYDVENNICVSSTASNAAPAHIDSSTVDGILSSTTEAMSNYAPY
jgi:hypothetical protein